MIEIEQTDIQGFEPALHGMRNPLNSHAKSDTAWEYIGCSRAADSERYLKSNDDGDFSLMIGDKDFDLATRLAKGGSVHAKYRRMITVWANINAPLYWWKEFDTYRNGVEKNSCSTMHRIAEHEFTLDDFSHDKLDGEAMDLFRDGSIAEGNMTYNCSALDFLQITCDVLNRYRDLYLKTKDKKWWWQMIQLLPSSYMQKRTVMMSYEALASMYCQRHDHKLDEWQTFCEWVEGLPISRLITCLTSDAEKARVLDEIVKLPSCHDCRKATDCEHVSRGGRIAYNCPLWEKPTVSGMDISKGEDK